MKTKGQWYQVFKGNQLLFTEWAFNRRELLSWLKKQGYNISMFVPRSQQIIIKELV